MFEGSRGLSGSAPCRWYIDEDIPEIRVLHAKYGICWSKKEFFLWEGLRKTLFVHVLIVSDLFRIVFVV